MPSNKKRKALAAKREMEEMADIRPPPDGLVENEYALCSQFMGTGCCQYGVFCISAHSVRELQEWKKQFIKKTTLKIKKNKTCAAKLLEQIEANRNARIVSSDIKNIICMAEPDLHWYIKKIPFVVDWKFLIHCYSPLLNVYLLFEDTMENFNIIEVCNLHTQEKNEFSMNEDKEWSNVDWKDDKSSEYQYQVKVNFETAVFGVFRQSVIFDFGFLPVLRRELIVEANDGENIVGENSISESGACKLVSTEEIWTSENTTIIPFNDQIDENHDLLKKYPLLEASPETPESKVTTLVEYKTKMHYYLSLEEFARFKIMSSFCMNIEIEAVNTYCRSETLSSVAKYAQDGGRFGRIVFKSNICEDTEYGKMLLSCRSLLISPSKNVDDQNPQRVAYISTIEDFSKNVIFVNLSARMVKELFTNESKTITVDIQFILNRLSYCEMQESLDRIECFGHLYPDLSSPSTITWDTYKQFTLLKGSNLNVKQREAVIAMVAPTKDPIPPVVIIGPFGTGKTFTLANAIPEILRDPKNNILICTHSNSAADIYIKDYLHTMRQSNRNIKPLRIYYTKRWRKSVPPEVLKYCLYNECELGFHKPTMTNILDNNVIITTINTSFCLSSLGIQPGFFTHIIIDEAAQIMECAALIPMSLANEKTRVILAGDHMQLGEEIFSDACKKEGFSISLLERLFKYYPDNHPCKILLRENYRSQETIVKLTSDLFYDGKICAKSEELHHLTYKPLCFFAAKGSDMQDVDSTSFYNQAEIMEVNNRINIIKEGWPLSWGPIDSTAFGVITPYLDQVTKTRNYLKKPHRGQVSVERIFNVQGKEFKVTVLSTVRTRNTCSQSDDESDYGFMSNPKLITTAITRAKYLVAIIGDPVALCTIGKCRNIWKEIVERCAKTESLYGFTLKQLQNHLRANELYRIHGLDPLATVFIPKDPPPGNPTNTHDVVPKRRDKQSPQDDFKSTSVSRMTPIKPMEQITPNQLALARHQSPMEHIATSIQAGQQQIAGDNIFNFNNPGLVANSMQYSRLQQLNRQPDFSDRAPMTEPMRARQQEPPATSVSELWDGNPFSSIWSVTNDTTSDREVTQSNLGRSVGNLNTINSRSIDHSAAAMLPTQNPLASQQIQLHGQHFSTAAHSLNVSNLFLPNTPVPIMMPPSQRNLSYNLQQNPHILSTNYQGTSLLSPSFSNNMLRHSLGRQESQIASQSSLMSCAQALPTTTSVYTALPHSHVYHANETSPRLPSSANPMQYASHQSSIAMDPFSSEVSSSGVYSSQTADQNPTLYSPNRHSDQLLSQSLTSPLNNTSTLPFSNNARSTTGRSRRNEVAIESIYSNPQLANSFVGQSHPQSRVTLPAEQHVPTTLNSEILNAHGIPIPSSQAMLQSSAMSIGQSGRSFQNLQIREGYQNPLPMPSYVGQTIRQTGRNPSNTDQLTFLDDIINDRR